MGESNVKFCRARKGETIFFAADIRLSRCGSFFESSSKTIHHVNDRTINEGIGAGSSNDP